MAKVFKFFIISYFFAVPVFAQQHSAEAWCEGSISGNITDVISAEFVTEARFQQTGLPLKSISGEFGVNYNISKPLTIGISYKGTQKNKMQGFFPTHTISATIGYKEKFGNFKVSYRNKFEVSRDMYVNEELDLLPTYEDRNKLKIQYKNKDSKIMPSINIESFHPISYSTIYAISEMRYGCGLDFDLKNKFELGLGYLYKVLYLNPGSESTSILSISISKGL